MLLFSFEPFMTIVLLAFLAFLSVLPFLHYLRSFFLFVPYSFTPYYFTLVLPSSFLFLFSSFDSFVLRLCLFVCKLGQRHSCGLYHSRCPPFVSLQL